MKHTLFLLLFSFVCQMLHAQPILTLADALSLTLLNNPELNAFSYDLRAADARRLQAGFIPNPVFDVETENFGAPIFMQTTLMLSQLIELGGKRQARLQFARAEKEVVELDYEVKKRELFVATTLLFIQVLINQQKIAFIEDNLRVLQDFSSVVKNRVTAGKASVIEEANFTVLLTTAAIDLKNAFNELQNAKIRLAAQWNEPNCYAYSIAGDLDWTPQVLPLDQIGQLVQEHPQVIRSYFEDNLRAAKLAVEQSRAYPDLNLRGGPRYLEEAHKWVFVIGFTIPIPIIDRNQGRIWEAYENWERLNMEREALWTRLLTDLNTSYATIQTVSGELALLKNSVLPAAQTAYDFSYKGYELARYNYLELLETERLYRTSRIRYLQALGEFHKALAILQGLTGSKAVWSCE